VAWRRLPRHLPDRIREMSAALSSTFKCRDTAGIEMGRGAVSSVTVASFSASPTRIARRVGFSRGLVAVRRVTDRGQCDCAEPGHADPVDAEGLQNGEEVAAGKGAGAFLRNDGFFSVSCKDVLNAAAGRRR